MKTYNTTKTYSLKDLLRETSLFILILGIIYAVILVWLPERMTIFSFIVPAILLLKDFYDKASRRRLQQLTFDSDKNEIVVFFKSLLSNVKQIHLSFDTAKLEVVKEKGKLKIFEPLTLYLLKDKMEVFELTKSKDKLSIDILLDIVRTAETYAIPIIYK